MNRKKLSRLTAVGIFVWLASTYLAIAYPTVFPTGTTIYKPGQA